MGRKQTKKWKSFSPPSPMGVLMANRVSDLRYPVSLIRQTVLEVPGYPLKKNFCRLLERSRIYGSLLSLLGIGPGLPGRPSWGEPPDQSMKSGRDEEGVCVSLGEGNTLLARAWILLAEMTPRQLSLVRFAEKSKQAAGGSS